MFFATQRDGVRGGTIDLGRVLAGERATAVVGSATVGVDDDLAAGQTGVGRRACPRMNEPVGLTS